MSRWTNRDALQVLLGRVPILCGRVSVWKLHFNNKQQTIYTTHLPLKGLQFSAITSTMLDRYITNQGVVSSFLVAIALSTRDRDVSAFKGRQHALQQNYGRGLGLLVELLRPGTAMQYERMQYERMQNEVLHDSDEEALTFGQAYTDDCNMTATAVNLNFISTD